MCIYAVNIGTKKLAHEIYDNVFWGKSKRRGTTLFLRELRAVDNLIIYPPVHRKLREPFSGITLELRKPFSGNTRYINEGVYSSRWFLYVYLKARIL